MQDEVDGDVVIWIWVVFEDIEARKKSLDEVGFAAVLGSGFAADLDSLVLVDWKRCCF